MVSYLLDMSSRKTALVTGASAGLGAQFARLFAADGCDLVLVARRRESLEALAAELRAEHAVAVQVIAADLARPEAAEALVAHLEGPVDYLVNNAGVGYLGGFAAADATRELAMLSLNMTTLVLLTRLLLPGMLARRSGRILNVGSLAGFMPGPQMASYYASKAFVNSFSEALSYELRGTGVTSTLLCPGATSTEFAAVAGVADSRLFKLGAMTATRVAAAGYRAMTRGRRRVIPGLYNKLSAFSMRLVPRGLATAIAASLHHTSGKALPAPPAVSPRISA